MTKRKRTPPSSLPSQPRVPFQIPASLQRLSVISRSLAHQSDKLAGANQDDDSAHTIAQAQALGVVPPTVPATSAGTAGQDGQGQGFRAFAPRKQPSFPDAQTWVEPKLRGSQIPDATGFMPPTQPSFPQGQTWPQPQPRKVIPWPQLEPQRTAAGAPAPPEAALANLEAPPAKGETLCLETQPHRIAALIAQKRAANEANRRREAWTRQAAAHRMSSQAPDDQLQSELNNALGQSTTNHTRNAGTGERQALRHPDQYVTPTAAITFDPVIPSAAVQVDSRTNAQTKKPLTDGKALPPGHKSGQAVKPTRVTSSHDHDSLFSSSNSPSPSPAGRAKPRSERSHHSAHQPAQHGTIVAQPSAAASTAPSIEPNATQVPPKGTKPKFSSPHADRSFARQSQQSNHATPVAAGYYRFSPRHWQTSSTSQQHQSSQAFAPATQSGHQRTEANAWPASRAVPQKVPPNPVFRNLTQDKFGRFGVGGKLKEVVGQQSGAGTS